MRIGCGQVRLLSTLVAVNPNGVSEPEFFARSDSIIQVMDARRDSLVEVGVAAGVLYSFGRSGGLRYLPCLPDRMR